jgi:hypothetical protein
MLATQKGRGSKSFDYCEANVMIHDSNPRNTQRASPSYARIKVRATKRPGPKSPKGDMSKFSPLIHPMPRGR